MEEKSGRKWNAMTLHILERKKERKKEAKKQIVTMSLQVGPGFKRKDGMKDILEKINRKKVKIVSAFKERKKERKSYKECTSWSFV